MTIQLKRDVKRLMKHALNSFECSVDELNKGVGFLLLFEGETDVETIAVEFAVEHYSQIGIHLHQADEHSLSDAIQTASKDGFDTIYIHSFKVS